MHIPNYTISNQQPTMILQSNNGETFVDNFSINGTIWDDAFPSELYWQLEDSGEIIYNNIDLLKSTQKDIQKIRGKNISAIFQEPMTSLNPLHTIEKQVNEILMIHSSISYSEATKKTKKLLITTTLFKENFIMRKMKYLGKW